jgi:hypothetical protein
MSDLPTEPSEVDIARLRLAGTTAAEQLKIAKLIVSDGGFNGPGVGPLFTAAVLQAIASNYLALTLRK